MLLLKLSYLLYLLLDDGIQFLSLLLVNLHHVSKGVALLLFLLDSSDKLDYLIRDFLLLCKPLLFLFVDFRKLRT